MTSIMRFAILAALLFIPRVPAVAQSGSRQTQSAQAELNAAIKQQTAARKQIALKSAAIEVEKKRVADLQKRVQQSQKRMAAEAAALAKATALDTTSTKTAAELAEQLKKHQAVDGLIAAAQAIQKQVDAAQEKHDALAQQLADAKNELFDQKQRETKAAADLKKAQEQLPKSKEELGKARTTLDAAGKEVDLARLAVTTAQTALKARQAEVTPQKARILRATAAHTQVSASVTSLQASLATLRGAAQSTGGNPDEAGADISKSLVSMTALQSKAAALVAAAGVKASEADKLVDAALVGVAASHGKLREMQNKYAEQSRAHFKLQLQIADLENSDRLHQKQLADAKTAQEQLTAKQTELTPLVAAAAGETAKLQTSFVSSMQLAENAMEPLNRFVSFSRDIAPIFAGRCVACHNTRTASGRLNMDSFAAILKGGESGVSFEAHEADDSLLMAMIEDGSMPKDADPLTKEQIALVQKWINAGAPLDAGIVATADLFQVMPEIPQPLPPKTYRVPIPVTAAAFNPEGNLLASSGYHEILLWNTDDNKLIRRISNVAERVYDLQFSADGTQLAVAAGTPGQLGEVKLFSVADGAHLKTLARTKDAVFAVSYSPDGKSIAAAGADRVVYAIDIQSGRITLQIEDHADWVMDINWSPDGKQLVSASRDKTSKVFNVADGRSVVTFNGHGNAVYAAAFLADGQSVVSAGSDKQLRVWKTADGKETRKIGGFGSDIFKVEVTADNHVLSASADSNAYQHNLADGKQIRKFAGHKDWVYTLSHSAKRKLLASGSYDGEIRVWNSEDGTVARSFIAVPQLDTKATVATAAE